jgi:pheromone shutdown protein TraB
MCGHAETRSIGTRIVLVGTIHVDPASISLVQETIKTTMPEIVALELDRERLRALENPSKQGLGISSGLSFLTMALLEKFAGRLTGSSPGLEMLAAARTARSVGAIVETIDRPIGLTAAGIRKLPMKEKIRLGLDGLASFALLPFGASDLSELTEDIDSQLRVFRARYPTLGRLLLDERELYMVNRLKQILAETRGRIVGVVGFGHLSTIAKALEDSGEGIGYSTRMSWSVYTG